MSAEELTGQARRAYESWRALGLSESAALEAVGDTGLTERRATPGERMKTAFGAMGLSESAAEVAVGDCSGFILEDSQEWEEAVGTAAEIHVMTEEEAEAYLRHKMAFGDWAALSGGRLLEALGEYARLRAGGRIS